MSVFAEDVERIKSKQEVNIREQLIRESRASGRNPLGMVIDHLRLRRGRGKLQLYEYFLYGLDDKDRLMSLPARRSLCPRCKYRP